MAVILALAAFINGYWLGRLAEFSKHGDAGMLKQPFVSFWREMRSRE